MDVKIDREKCQKLTGPAFDCETTLPQGEPRKHDSADEQTAQEMKSEPGDTDVPRCPPGHCKVAAAPGAIGFSA